MEQLETHCRIRHKRGYSLILFHSVNFIVWQDLTDSCGSFGSYALKYRPRGGRDRVGDIGNGG